MEASRSSPQLALVERAQVGDQAAFERLVATRINRLHATARLMLRQSDSAEDAVQEALVRAWRDLPSLRDPERFDAWLHRLLAHACAEEGRRRGRWRLELRVLQIEPASDDRTLDDVADTDEVERAFRHLSEPHRVVLALQHVLGLSPAEAAATIGVPIGTVKSRTHFALRALHAALAAEARGEIRRAAEETA